MEKRVLGALAGSFLWVVAVDFYVENQKRSFPVRIALWLGGILVIAILFRFAWDIWFSPPLLLGSLLLLVGLAGHLGRGESNATFWLFNHRLWLGALLAFIAAGLFGAGLSIIHGTLNLLFGLHLPAKWHEYIWTISLGLVAPVSFLALAPRSFTDPITAREESEFTMRAIAALVKFVLVPLLLVYTAILYAYAIKIVLAWELPKGTLGAMVVGYLLVGAATLLVGYPSRENGGSLVSVFWRYWVWLAALPVVLLFIAVWRRISDYGVTDQRYLMVLIGVWALLLAGFRIIRGSDFDLRLVPGVLALLLAAASFGPGGAVGFSVMSQKSELASILSEKGMLVDGKVVRQAEGSAGAGLVGADAARVRGIEWYLNTHRSLSLLAPWFEGQPNDPFAAGKKPEETARELLVALGLRPDIGNGSGAIYFTHYSDVPATLSLAKSGTVVGPIVFKGGDPVPFAIPPQTVAVEGLGTIQIELADKLLTVSLDNGASVKFDIADAMTEVYRRGWPKVDDHHPIELKGMPNGLDGTVVIDNMNGTYMEPDLDISLLRFWLILSKSG
ncbi:MAG TPA: DUF4153 domain-containing protein [Methyloceanibacter sp.]|nr:DUF4153 domain-containing protein [Methyloceanibacter sp.]